MPRARVELRPASLGCVLARGFALLGLTACSPQLGDAAARSCGEPSKVQASPTDPSAAVDRTTEIAALAERARELYEVPGLAIAVVSGDELVLARGYGEREFGEGVAVDSRTSFSIASNTKAFAATAVGLLVADGVIDWDDRVIDHLPDLKLWNDYVTRELRVRDLLSHRVGLATWEGDLIWTHSNFSFADIYARLQYLKPEAGLRERFGYCNLMYGVAGELIRAKSGMAWDAFVRARLIEPLGMQSVVTRHAQLEGRDDLATPHVEADGQWRPSAPVNLDVVGPAGSFYASALDMSKWLRMQLAEGEFEGRRIVPEAVILETRQPHIWLPTGATDFHDPARHLRSYGLGWYLEDYRGRLLVVHDGWLPGMSSVVLMVPDEDFGVVVLSNGDSPAASLLALQVADLYLSVEPGKDYLGAYLQVQTEAEAEPEAKLGQARDQGAPLPAGLEGEYASPLLGAARIVAKDGGLWFEAYEHGGLRCRFADHGEAPAPDVSYVACTWDDRDMGVSRFGLVRGGAGIRALRFRVRPEAYDPLEYEFTRTR